MTVGIDAGTSLGAVELTVADLDGTAAFYERAVGLEPVLREPDGIALGAAGTPLLRLVGDPGAPPRPAGTSGLFHLAILVPSHTDLARALRRVAAAGAHLTGASDHLVSEALYLRDPEGNGIEIYRDRPVPEWQHEPDGTVRMATLPLDLESLAAIAVGDGDSPERMPDGTRIGHVHLNVADLDDAERFYVGALGFEVTVRSYPGALFVSAGGYHHHLGLNVWTSAGGAPPPAGARGLREFEILVPDGRGLERVADGLRDLGAPFEAGDGSIRASDPSGNRLRLRGA